MIRNVAIKKFLKSMIVKPLSLLNRLVFKRNDYILLYSANKGIEFNLLPLKNYLITNGYDKRNKIVCGIEDIKYAGQDTDCVKYVTHLRAMLFFLRAGHVFYTTGQIPIKPSKDQKVLHLQHGTTFKTCGALTEIHNGDEFFFTACLATSEIYRPIYAAAFQCSEECILINSEPVTDIFFGNYHKYDLGDYRKILLWTPTFRKSDYLGYDNSEAEELLPMFAEKDYFHLSDVLSRYNFKLIVKIHGAQSLKNYREWNFTNLEILSNDDFEAKGYALYELLTQTDMLISDYSSLFLQYLLLDKPIAFVIPDIEEYEEKRGFVFKNPEEWMPGIHIKTQAEFYQMLDGFASGKDDFAEARKAIKGKIHQYADGKSCARLIEMSGIR